MEHAIIGARETPEQLSARLGLPLCMLLRANRLYSPAWLLPGRMIVVPDAAFCRRDAGACPVRMLSAPAEAFCADRATAHLPARLQLWSRTHAGACLAQWSRPGRALTVRPGESMRSVARRAGIGEAELRRINRFFGRPVPGMTLWAPFQSGKNGV